MKIVIWKRKSFWLFLGVLALGLLVAMRDLCAVKLAELYVHRLFKQQGWYAKEIETKQGVLFLQGIEGKVEGIEAKVREATCSLHLSFMPPFLETNLSVEGLSFTVFEPEAPSHALKALGSMGGDTFIGQFTLSVKEGELLFPSRDLAFSFQFTQEEGGCLHLQEQGSAEDLLTAYVQRTEALISFRVALQPTRIGALCPLVLPSLMPGSVEGTLSARASLAFARKGGLQSAEGEFTVEGLSLSDPSWEWKGKASLLEGSLRFEPRQGLPFWRQADLFLTFAGTELRRGEEFTVEQALGKILLRPEEDPYVKAEGRVLVCHKEVPFLVEGRGETLEEGAYWLQGKALFSPSGEESHLSFSLCQTDARESALDIECVHLVPEVVAILQQGSFLLDLPKLSLEQGKVEGRVFARFLEGRLVFVEIPSCEGKNIVLSLPDYHLSLSAEALAVQGTLEAKDTQLLTVESAMVEMHKGALGLRKAKIDDLTGLVKVKEGRFLSSYLEGTYEGMKANVQLLPDADGRLLHVECGAYLGKVAREFFPDLATYAETGPALLAFDLWPKENKARFAGTVRFLSPQGEGEDLEVEGVLQKRLSPALEDLFSPWSLAYFQGSFEAKSLSTRVFLPGLLAEVGTEAKAHVQGVFSERGVDVSFEEMNVAHHHGEYSMEGTMSAELHYDKDKGLKGKGVLKKAFLFAPDLTASLSKTEFSLERGCLFTPSWRAQALGGDATGSFFFDGDLLEVKVKQAKFPLSSFFPSYKGLVGSLIALEEKCQLQGKREENTWNWKWQGQLSVREASYDLGALGSLQKASAALSIRSGEPLLLTDMQALYCRGNFSCPLYSASFVVASKSPFSLVAKEGHRELLSLTGIMQQEEDGVRVDIDPSSHLLGIRMQIDPITYRKDQGISSIAGSFDLDLQYLQAYALMGARLGLWQELSLPSLGGALRANVHYDVSQDRLRLRALSSSLVYEKESLGALQLQMQKVGEVIDVDPCSLGAHQVKMRLHLQESGWQIASLSLQSPNLQTTLQGTYFPRTKQFSFPSFSVLFQRGEMEMRSKGKLEGQIGDEGITGRGMLLCQLPLSTKGTLSLNRETPFFFSSRQGAWMESSTWLAKDEQGKLLGSLTPGRLSYLWEGKRLSLSQATGKVTRLGFSLFYPDVTSFLKEEEVAFCLEGDISPSLYKLSGTVEQLSCLWQEAPLDVGSIRFLLEKDELYLSCQPLVDKEPFFVNVKKKEGKDASLTVLLKEDKDKPGLSFYLLPRTDGGWILEYAQGACRGLALTMKRESRKGSSSYEVDLSLDGKRMAPLLPKAIRSAMETFEVGRGYQYRGRLTLDPTSLEVKGLSGTVEGKEFECLGRTFSSFKAGVVFEENKGVLQGFQLEDEAACVTIKTMELYKKDGGKWEFSLPLLSIKDCLPSLCFKGKREGSQIRNLSLYEVKGVWGDWSTLTGRGSFHFQAPLEKKLSLWEAPLSLIKDLGLDPGMFSPVTGEVDFTFVQGRAYLTAIKNVYSEGRRSQFVLADPGTDAYLSLDGSLHIDLQMKQNVVLKTTEHLILSIRGSLKEPKYSVKWKKD